VARGLVEVSGHLDWPRAPHQSPTTSRADSSTGPSTRSGPMPSSRHLLSALLALGSAHAVSARIHASLIPEDPHAFPKYDVTFLHGLPVLNETAERWLHDGLQGGLLEFLEEPWVSKNSPWSKLKGIDPTEVSCFPPQVRAQLNARIKR